MSFLATCGFLSPLVITEGFGSGGAAATTATFTGPTTGTVGLPTTNFTVSLDGLYTGTVTLGDSSEGGTFTPTSLSWVSSAASQTATYTPAVAGTIPISILASPSLSLVGSPINLVVGGGPGTVIVFVDPRQGTVLE